MTDDQSTDGSEIAELAQRVRTARGMLPLQYDSALLDVLSERELAAERDLAEWSRDQRRKHQRRQLRAELAAERRDLRSAAAMRRADEADARWHRRALAARRRVSSADARLAQLFRRAEWSSRALIAVVVLGMVWAGVNVQHNLVPSGDMTDPLYWLSYGIEAMISIPIITIMVATTTAARWGREPARGKVIFFETALLGTTVALNAGPHAAAGEFGRAAEYAIAPVMVGVVIWLHAWVAARYAELIDAAAMDRESATETETANEPRGFSGEDSAVPGASRPLQALALSARATGSEGDPASELIDGPTKPHAVPTPATATSRIALATADSSPPSEAEPGVPIAETGDEISGLAKTLNDAGLSALPVEDVRDILTLSDDGSTAEDIAQELGIPHSAVAHVLNKAVQVRRPYAVTG